MSNSRPSLSQAFAPVSPRGAKLEGLLPPKRKKAEESHQEAATTQDPAPISVAPDLPSESPAAANSTSQPSGSNAGRKQSSKADVENDGGVDQQQQKQSARTKVTASESVTGALRNVGVYLAPDLLDTVKETIHSQRTTYADLLLDAFDAVRAETIAHEFKAEYVPSSSGMPRRVPRRRGEAGIQIQVRLDGHQVKWLDDKVVEFNAPSRSALVSAAYRLYLSS